MLELKEKKIKALTLSHRLVLFVAMFPCKNLKTQIASNTMYRKGILFPHYTQKIVLTHSLLFVSYLFLCSSHFNKYGDSTSRTWVSLCELTGSCIIYLEVPSVHSGIMITVITYIQLTIIFYIVPSKYLEEYWQV